MKITYIYPQEDRFLESTEWRCRIPAQAINRNGRHGAYLVSFLEFLSRQPQAYRICERSDVLVIHGRLWGDVVNQIQHWRARGKTVIVDFQEPYQLLNDTEQQRLITTTEQKGGLQLQQPPVKLISQIKWTLQSASAATVPSKRLADDWKGYVPLDVIPSYIDLEQYLAYTPVEHEGIILGWRERGGRLSVLRESGLLEALREICQMKPQVRLMICCDEVFPVEKLGIKSSQVIIKKLRRGAEWLRYLSMFDAGLAPLAGEADQRSSWIPVLEYMVMKVPWVGSQGAPYRDVRPYGWLVENDVSSWLSILTDLVDHLEDYKAEAHHFPYLFGLGQSIDEKLQHVISTYAKIMENSQDKIPATVSRPMLYPLT